MRDENKKQVLVVESDEQALAAFQASLEDAGIETQATWSGRDALSELGTGRFGLLLTDDYLPDLHVSEFLKRVNRMSRRPTIVVMHSGVPKSSTVRRYRTLGAFAVVDKRDPDAVCRTVVAGCGGVETERAAKR